MKAAVQLPDEAEWNLENKLVNARAVSVLTEDVLLAELTEGE